ncbi:MAG: hypothetical protein KJO82_07390, partial [Gammaproteobacteria bacterium]|nr:hypothetical protein [Gammaproteobacteria bacterium]
MNKYPSWLNFLVLTILLAGILFALPNIYGSAPAVQIADKEGAEVLPDELDSFVRIVENSGVTPEAAYMKDGRVVIRFASVNDQAAASALLRENYARTHGVATTLAPRLPEWMRNLGLSPMSLGLDLRGGVYVLLEVDMQTAVNKRLELYQEDFDDRLRDARIRHRVDLADGVITVRLSSDEDVETSREIIRDADADVIISDGADGRSLRIRMTDAQVQERQNLAIEQNITTLRNRVNEL